jgi:hypothetical protein
MRRLSFALIPLGALACSGGVEPSGLTPAAAMQPVLAEECLRAEPDLDQDGLSDACEVTLVSAFAPILVVAPDQCLPSAGLPPGGYLHGAQPIGPGVRLVYLPAYFVDCGWAGFKCHIPRVDCSAHSGDSEFIALDVFREAGTWRVGAVFLSAHCFDQSGGDCRWYRGAELADFSWVGSVGGVPTIWVSEGRNANYPSRRSCDRGHYFLDSCDLNSVSERFPVHEGRNIGSRLVPIRDVGAPPGCVRGALLGDRRARAEAVECFWRDDPFRGWQEPARGATAYAAYLGRVAEF